jgi:hypothetical protein
MNIEKHRGRDHEWFRKTSNAELWRIAQALWDPTIADRDYRASDIRDKALSAIAFRLAMKTGNNPFPPDSPLFPKFRRARKKVEDRLMRQQPR